MHKKDKQTHLKSLFGFVVFLTKTRHLTVFFMYHNQPKFDSATLAWRSFSWKLKARWFQEDCFKFHQKQQKMSKQEPGRRRDDAA